MTSEVPGQFTGENKDDLFRSIIESSNEIIISKTINGIITSWNPAAERTFGYSEHEAIGQHIFLIIPPERRYEEEQIIREILKGNKIELETVRVDRSGNYIPVLLSISPVRNMAGEVTGASKIGRDISEKKRFEEKNAFLAAIINTSDDAIISKTLEGIITSWNIAAERMFGYTSAEVIGRHISLLIPKDRLAEEAYIIGQIAAGNKVDHFETLRLASDGRLIPISLSVSPIKDTSGKITGASKIARDISLQKTAQAAILSYTHNLETINAVNRIILQELDQQNILQKVTDITTEITGAQFGAFFYNVVTDNAESYMLFTLSGAPREAFEGFGMPSNTAVFQPTFSGEAIVRVDDITKDPRYGHNAPHYGMPKGHLPVVSYLAVPVVSQHNVVIGGLFFGHSAPAMFTADHEKIVQSIASLAAIGLEKAKLYEKVISLNDKKDEFIGLASHELKTPLTSIMGYLQIMDNLTTDHQHKKFLDKALLQTKKLSALVSDLLDVSKIEAGKLQLSVSSFDMRKLMDDAIELIQYPAKSHRILFNTTVKRLFMQGDPQRIEQVIINLLTNAIKYSPAADIVEVMLDHYDDNVHITVKDYGKGIPQDKQAQIFNRFFRAEDEHSTISGLGIGLYISKEIILRHNGSIWVESLPGKGSSFYIELPG